ncbi:tRNA (cytosine(34)-C(5))-methyltransferase, mitochondrial isoform X2 [Python bivittatus]|uniref:tRNA (Cytosine(34)-C(5))-methyltransferase, mitochondrial isoform X2 n=1 Tax=Python bivittatus TaxID=176946 RepID=A0A9F5IG96_PYTBI|nr:tRNA (cytosine(34)-C(5))-methyltransferase, mitochondrial isoform X2 [Python bivittatus]
MLSRGMLRASVVAARRHRKERYSSAKGQKESTSEKKLQKQICQVVLNHFEEQYSKELGGAWNSVREVLTTPLNWQYAVLLNKFNYSSEMESYLGLKDYRLLFPRTSSSFPQSLKCYISDAPGRFPAQKHRDGQLKEYYLLNAASLLAVLALEVKDGEKVLDMCAAPGGKSVATLQCACPESLMSLITVSPADGREIGNLQPERFDKILVDAPCSNDRSWLFSSDTQQATLRLAQRKLLSAVQIQLLRSAIKALRPGGCLVYSTCTLSKAENNDVINHILDSCSNVLPVDLHTLVTSVSKEFTFAANVQQHELLVLPERGKAWGPMYISKLKKV